MLVALGANMAAAQSAAGNANELRREMRFDKSLWKDAGAADMKSGRTAAEENGFYDNESFGKNAKFLGAFYAGTVYVYRSCDPQILLDELGLTLAPDDKCFAHTVAAPMTMQTVFDPAWRITIPGKTVDNVIFPMLNNNAGFDSFSSTPGVVNFLYSPQVTIESSALNDPAAINPNTGQPMNGSYTTSISGAKTRSMYTDGLSFLTDYDTYASVPSRGLSRDYFAAIGLPQHVIDKLFKKPMTLKFGLRARVTGPVDYAHFYFTYRLLGN